MRVITGATGLIGRHLVEHWLSQNHPVTVVGRTRSHIQEIFGARVQAVTWDELTSELLQSAEVVVNLAGANIAEKRWSESRRKEVLESRVDTTKKIAELLAKLGELSPPLFNASAIGIYGLQKQQAFDDIHFDENSEIDWEHPKDFLSRVARQWEMAAKPAIDAGVRVVFLRFSVVLANDGGALPQLVLPYKFFLGGIIGSGRQPFCWIAINDVVSAIDFLIEKKTLSGPFNFVSPECVSHKVLSETIGRVLHRPNYIHMPGLAFKLLLGKDMAQELLLEGQNVYPKRLIDAGYVFKYPNLEAALEHILE